jgi:ABC-type uncharacterized transport system substrate-binding protein
MAMTRRWFLASVPALTTALACSATQKGGTRSGYREILAAGSGARTILVCMPDTPQTREVWRGLSDELGQEFRLVAVAVESRADSAIIERGIQTHSPAALVLMNNPTVSAYRGYAGSADARRLPSVVVMTSFLDGAALRAIGATGISYEVPLITAVTNLRKVLATSVETVGVAYRAPLASFVKREVELASREKIRVVERPLSDEPNSSEIKRALRELKQEADAVWVLNDDRVLTPQLISQGWLPGLNEKPWRPTIVGVASLVSTSQALGTLAVMPDHTALGVQAANLVYDIADNEWQVPEAFAQLPLSTNTAFDLHHASERFELKQGALAQVDKVVE